MISHMKFPPALVWISSASLFFAAVAPALSAAEPPKLELKDNDIWSTLR